MRFLVPILAVLAFAATLGWLGWRNGMWTGATPPPATASRGDGSSAGETGNPRMAQDDGVLGTTIPATPNGDASGAGSRTAGLPATAPSASAPIATPPGAGLGATTARVDGVPHVDVVRVEPTGEAVVAGRAPVGTTVALLVDGQPVATVAADANGQFVLLPPPIPAGSHDVELVATSAAAGQPGVGTSVRSPETVTVVVADNRRDAPLVTVAAEGKPTVVVSSPDGASAPTRTAAQVGGDPASGTVTRVETVEREATGDRLHVSGRAAPNATVRLYLDDRLAGSATADPQGRVAFTLAEAPSASVRVRLDAVEPDSGTVRSRSEVSFAPEPPKSERSASAEAPRGGSRPDTVASADPATTTPAAVVPSSRPGVAIRDEAARRARTAARTRPGRAAARRPVEFRVLPGQSLWQISQRVYGEGLRFTVIYGANSGQIANPNVIYPGQVFRLPASRVSGALR